MQESMELNYGIDTATGLEELPSPQISLGEAKAICAAKSLQISSEESAVTQIIKF